MFETLGHFKILDRIGAGGMGEVYRARDTRLGRTVAIKVLPPSVLDDQGRRERFLRDAHAAAALSHPNIAALYEVGEDQGSLFLAFEYASGETLRTAIGGQPMNPRHAVDLATQIADALADAHAAGVIDGDVKPDNIVITSKGRAKILDLGLAPWTNGGVEREQAAAHASPAPASVGATLAYMSPEQALGGEIDHRTDIFSLGVMLFEMLTGKPPFTAPTAEAMMLQVVQAPVPPPSSVNRSIPREIDGIVLKALSKDLDQRYESAATLAAELRAIGAVLDVRAESAEAEAHLVQSRPSAPSRWPFIVAIVMLAVLAALAWLEWDVVRRLWEFRSAQ